MAKKNSHYIIIYTILYIMVCMREKDVQLCNRAIFWKKFAYVKIK